MSKSTPPNHHHHHPTPKNMRCLCWELGVPKTKPLVTHPKPNLSHINFVEYTPYFAFAIFVLTNFNIFTYFRKTFSHIHSRSRSCKRTRNDDFPLFIFPTHRKKEKCDFPFLRFSWESYSPADGVSWDYGKHWQPLFPSLRLGTSSCTTFSLSQEFVHLDALPCFKFVY